jgi:LacI family transcriptional regulator
MRRIALAIDLDWPVRHHQGIASGALRYGREKGWSCEVDPFPEAGPARYDGVIGRVTRALSRWAARTRTPVVNVWINSPDRRLPRVVVDTAAGGRLAARHFLDRGLRRFAYLGRERDLAAEGQFEGFRAALPEVVRLEVPAEASDSSGWRRLQRPLRRWVAAFKPPIGVLASSDILARHLCNACLRAGLRVPDDVAVVGTGNTTLICDLLEPTLSSLEHGFERIGRRAAELLDALMRRRRPPSEPVLLPPSEIVARRSSDHFAVEDPAVAAALRTIWARSGKPLKVAAILEEVPVGRRTLERRFRRALGRTVHDEIRRAHLERARRLLVESSEPLKTVAARAGFRDPQDFSRVFRSSEGRTPQEYRRDYSR